MPPRPASSGHRALRRARHSAPGQIYLLTSVTRQRRPLFADWETASCVCAVLGASRLWRDSLLLCWVLMPDHVHLLVSLGQSEPLQKLMQRVKAVTSHATHVMHPLASGSTWMSAFHDRALRRDEDMVALARYVVMNPVRAGLVQRVGDYPYWDAVWI